MRYLKNILLLSLFFSSVTFANKTDIYFGNGILTIEKDAQMNSELLYDEIKANIYNGNKVSFEEDINKVSYAYNQTKGFFYVLSQVYKSCCLNHQMQ